MREIQEPIKQKPQIHNVIREDRNVSLDNLVVSRLYKLKTVETKTGSSVLRVVELTDNTSKIKFELWGSTTNSVNNDDEIVLFDTYIKKFAGKMSLSLGKQGILVNKTSKRVYKTTFSELGYSFHYSISDLEYFSVEDSYYKLDNTYGRFRSDHNEFESYISNLFSEDPKIRKEAIKNIGQYRNDYIEENLRDIKKTVVNDPRQEVRKEAISALGKMSEIKNIPFFIYRLETDRSNSVKAEIIKFLGYYGEGTPEEELKVIVKALEEIMLNSEDEKTIRNCFTSLDYISKFYSFSFDYHQVAMESDVHIQRKTQLAETRKPKVKPTESFKTPIVKRKPSVDTISKSRIKPRVPYDPSSALPKSKRVYHQTKCSYCGITTAVPFKPDGIRPVFCHYCLKNKTREYKQRVVKREIVEDSKKAISVSDEIKKYFTDCQFDAIIEDIPYVSYKKGVPQNIVKEEAVKEIVTRIKNNSKIDWNEDIPYLRNIIVEKKSLLNDLAELSNEAIPENLYYFAIFEFLKHMIFGKLYKEALEIMQFELEVINNVHIHQHFIKKINEVLDKIRDLI